MGARLFEVLLWVWGVLVTGIGLNWFTDVFKWTSLQAHPWGVSAGFLLLSGSTGWTFRSYRYAEAAKHFALCKEAKDLLPEDLDFQEQKPGTKPEPGSRPYNTTYIPRKAEDSNANPNTVPVYDEPMLVNLLRNGKGLLFVGPPGAGKTRTLFSLLRNLGRCIVLKPTRDQPLPPDEAFRILKGRQVVVLLNDLDTYANHSPDLQEFCKKVLHAPAISAGVAATCRDGKALVDVAGNSLRRLYEDSLRQLTLVQLTPAEQQRLAASVKRPWRPAYATPGDIVMEDMREIMKKRFDHDLSLDCRDVLRAIKLLTAAKLALTSERLEVVLLRIFKKSPHIMDCLRILAEQSFIDKRLLPATIYPEPYYLQHIVPYERGDGEPAVDFSLLMQALEASKDADGLYTLGRAFYARNDTANAQACVTKVTTLQPDFPQKLRVQADEAYAAARYQEALELYDYLLLLQPNDAEMWYSKAVCLYRLRRYEEALVACEEEIKLQPDKASGWTNKGVTLRDLGRHTEALDAHEGALELQPDNALAWDNKGITLRDLGRHAEALKAYERALELQPDHLNAWRQVARLAEAQGDLVKAEKARLEVRRLEREEKEKKS